ncbi:16S rRNA (cytosine(967)-C(5))-methyltransferase RsmB [Holdemania filiformis]|uniref:16S rRNA (cytosine(967)-C(5))-methyltransferase RsmB n=1 Tax=Holdemania filiformis TaxID=61171 RepID=UPI0026708B1C|nr:16S rRNA (cytosine(967)-C(5))-methyltransferase RsmB [Holdemania filiformis]
MNTTRKRAWQGLNAILNEGQYANLWLRQHGQMLSEEEKRWVTAVIYGVLRHREPLRWQWRDLVRNVPEPSVAVLLDMSVYQLFYLDKGAAYAIVNAAVELCPRSKKGLVNAVLRQLLRRGPKPLPKPESIADLALVTSHPQWLLQLWKAHYGEEKMRRIALADLEEAAVSVRINPLKLSREALAQRPNWALEPNGWTIRTAGNPVSDPWLKEGKIVIQDRSSQQVALMLDPKPNDTVFDACSAPGTKTTQLAAMMNNEGSILACDLHAHRLALVEEAAQRCGAAIIQTQTLDAAQADQQLAGRQFDRVLLDVPCSGLGVLRHKPEILLRLTPDSLDEIVALQAAILTHCAPLCKPGGTLVYSTCTLNRKENDKQVAAFLLQHPEFELMAEQTIFPDEGAQDGFYIAKMTRRG